MPTMWKTDHSEFAPIEVECETPEHPHRDADGERIYENTHFLTIEEAWERMLTAASNHEIWRLQDVDQQREILQKKEREMFEASGAAIRIRVAYAEWVEAQKEAE